MDKEIMDMVYDINNNLALLQEFLEENLMFNRDLRSLLGRSRDNIGTIMVL